MSSAKKNKTGSVVNVVESPPSHLVRPNVAAVEVGVSCPGVDGVLVKVFGNIFGCCLWKQPVNTLPVKKHPSGVKGAILMLQWLNDASLKYVNSHLSVAVPFCQHIQNGLALSPAVYHPSCVEGRQKTSGTARSHRPERLRSEKKNTTTTGGSEHKANIRVTSQELHNTARPESDGARAAPLSTLDRFPGCIPGHLDQITQFRVTLILICICGRTGICGGEKKNLQQHKNTLSSFLTSSKLSPTSATRSWCPNLSRTSAAFSEACMLVKSNMATSGCPQWFRA